MSDLNNNLNISKPLENEISGAVSQSSDPEALHKDQDEPLLQQEQEALQQDEHHSSSSSESEQGDNDIDLAEIDIVLDETGYGNDHDHEMGKVDEERKPNTANENSHSIMQKFETAPQILDGSESDNEEPKPRIIVSSSVVINSDLSIWRNKMYIGGFRHKTTKIEYFHAVTQTKTDQDIKNENKSLLFHRDSQTCQMLEHNTQTDQEKGTQMTKSGCYISKENDKIIKSRPYVTAANREAMKNENALIIQCFVRRFLAVRKVKRVREARRLRTRAFQERERKKLELLEKKRKTDNERRLHPKSNKDFEILYNGLDSWRAQETTRINKLKLIEPARLAALAELLDQETALLQKIDKLKIEANLENKEKTIVNLLEKVAAPKVWLCDKDKVVHVDTPNIVRARELRDLYHALNFPKLTIDERLQILLHVKFTTKEFDCNLTREIVELIDREGDLISRGRKEESLEGLRKRISGLFLQFVKTPEFNPEIATYIKLGNTDHQTWKESAVYYCRGCTKYKASTEFYLSTTLRHLGKCKDCSMKENLSIQKTDDTSYGSLLTLIRHQEQTKRRASNPNGGKAQNAMALLQESDLRYLIDVVWNRKSVISGVRNVDQLILTRWDPKQELSPWNCILMTKSEAATHDCQLDPDSLYSVEFRQRIFQKHLSSRQHFGQLPQMAEYLAENYREEQNGKMINIAVNA